MTVVDCDLTTDWDPMDAVRELLNFSDVTNEETQMILDWENQLRDLAPVMRIMEWRRVQRMIKEQLARRAGQGENLNVFKNSKSHIDSQGRLVSGRLQYKILGFDTPQIWKTLQIPLTENCNLLCRHCPRTQKYLSKDVPFETFKKYLDKFSPERFQSLLLSEFGEPYLRKDILEILRYAKKQGFQCVETITTGNLINKKLRKAILDEGLLGKLVISIEAASKELYQSIRGSDLDSMKRCVADFIDYRNRIGAKYPEVVFNVVCMKDNAHELPLIMDLAHELGIDYVLFVHLNGVVSDFSNEERSGFEEKLLFSKNHLNTCDRETIVKIFQKIHEKSIEYGIGYFPPEEYLGLQEPATSRQPLKENISRCDQPYEWVQVQANGNLYPCCQIAQRYSVGNIQDKNFEEVWNDPKYVEFRQGLKNGNPNSWCTTCNMYNGKRF